MKVLHVMNDFPYPPNHGGRVDMWGRLMSLVELGFEVDAVVTLKMRPSEDDLNRVRGLVRRLYLVDRRPNWTGILSASPVQVFSRGGLRDIRLTDHYDVVLGESEFSFPIFENKSLDAGKKILRIHNDESRFMRELAENERNWFKRRYYREESKRFQSFSRKAFKVADYLWFSSADQHRDYVQQGGSAHCKAAWLPPPIDFGNLVAPSLKTSKKVLFVGTLAASSNIEAIDWYLSGVHPRLKHIEGYQFVIAGNTRGFPISQIIQKAAAEEDCILHTDVDDLSSLYKQSAVFANCMVRGASIKMKTINAIEKGLPVVSTTIGNEGTGFSDGEHIRIADMQEEFAAAIINLLNHPRAGLAMAEKAQGFLRSKYRHGVQISSLLGLERGTVTTQ